jgi:RNA polymerase sigma-70 factor (TIGR02943 family)
MPAEHTDKMGFLPDPALLASAPVDAAATARAGTVAALAPPDAWVDEYGDYLFSYALTRLRDPDMAADFVQETFLAALKAQQNFAGKSSPKSWLVGILKNKIVDHFRRASRETSFTDLEFLKDEMQDCFIAEGVFKDGWLHERGPVEWDTHPGASLDREEFWKTFQECAGKLPGNVARVFLLREIDDVASEEICRVMNITPNNLWVMLHRARMALRRCLEANWFGKLEGGAP